VDVLQDPEIRQGIKAYSDWPTIPQLYVKGEFVGGSDIMMEMFEAGELQQLMAEKQVASAAEDRSRCRAMKRGGPRDRKAAPVRPCFEWKRVDACTASRLVPSRPKRRKPAHSVGKRSVAPEAGCKPCRQKAARSRGPRGTIHLPFS
jgi:hypothetical protein